MIPSTYVLAFLWGEANTHRAGAQEQSTEPELCGQVLNLPEAETPSRTAFKPPGRPAQNIDMRRTALASPHFLCHNLCI